MKRVESLWIDKNHKNLNILKMKTKFFLKIKYLTCSTSKVTFWWKKIFWQRLALGKYEKQNQMHSTN